MKRKSTYRRNQRGVALLFALGVLSLLLVMGLAFVANSLLAQKVASNNSSRSQAKMLAQSAISRIATSVLYYQNKANESAIIPHSYMDIFSCYDLPKYKALLNYRPHYQEAEKAKADDADGKKYLAAKDGLRTADSKLMPPGWLKRDDVDDDDWEKDLRGQWSYITTEARNNDEKDSDYSDEGDKVKLIGRVAFQTFPSAGTAQINLDHVLRGIYEQGEPKRTPWNTRIGADINELNLDGVLAPPGSTPAFDSDSANLSYQWPESWSGEKNLPLPENMHAGTFDAFFQAYWGELLFKDQNDADKQTMQNWIHHWFSEGTAAADPEYFRYDGEDGTKYYHRFNLGKLDDKEASSAAAASPNDEWYKRLGITDDKNSQTAVDNLARDSVEFKITDQVTPEGVGLPFLKLIGSSRGTFEKIEDRRRQIAANLNDYCDSDSIPTSDVSSSTPDVSSPSVTESWGTVYDQEMAKWPKYTGNEKTPYINELAFGFKVDPSLKKGTGSYASFDVNVNLKVSRAELIAELIQIYKDLINKDDVENKNDYELRAHLKSLNLKFKVTAKGTLTYTKSDGSAATASLAETSFEEEIKYDGQNVILPFNTDNPIWNKGYLVYAKELEASSSSPSPKDDGIDFDFSTKFPTVSGTVTKATLDEVKIEVTSAKFKLGGIVLMDMHDAAKPFGVDFVRWEDDSTDGIPEAPPDSPLPLFSNASVPGQGMSGSGWIVGSSLGSIPEGYHYFYLGGMEAKDPRQNLNAEYTASVTKKEETDWSLPDSIKLVDFDNASGVMSIKMADKPEAVTGDKVADRLVAGKCNHDVNPKTAGDSNPDECDAEFVGAPAEDQDPAWRGDDVNGHLSTAYIRNAPMQSPWELGVIHRAMAWQTLNLKSAKKPVSTSDTATETAVSDDNEPISSKDMNPKLSWEETTGTSFAGGDGGLLEQIKMTDKAYCYGKLNVNMLSSDPTLNPDCKLYPDYNDESKRQKYADQDGKMVRALFFNIERSQSVGDLFVDDSGSYPEPKKPITWADINDTAVASIREAVKKFGHTFENRAQFLAWKDSDDKCLANGFGIISDADYENWSDAQREEIVGKTINLLKGTNSVSNMIRFVVVAQTIRDVAGNIARIRYDGTVQPRECRYGVFDVEKDGSTTFPEGFPENDKYLYFDEITGEVKLLVTMENNISTGQIIVRQIEYLE